MKKICSILLIITILFSTVGAVDVLAESTCTLSVSNKSGMRNDTIDISVFISGNSNMQACGFELKYDKDVLELINAERGTVISSSPIINTNQLGKIVYSYASTSPLKTSGSLLDIQFKIKTDAAYGSTLLDLDVQELSNGNFENISCTVNDGQINVIAPVLDTPSYIEASEVQDTYAAIIWQGVEGATGYNVYLNGNLFTEEPLNDNYCTFTELEQDTDYNIQVTTLHYETESEKSEVCLIHTKRTQYSVLFVDWSYGTEEENENSILEIVYVEHGEDVSAPETPVRKGYKFIGWDGTMINVTSNRIIQAQYEKELYTVTFVDWDGTVLDTQTVNYGEVAIAPEAPTRDGYVFTIWDCAFDNVTTDLTVTAQYSEITCEHANTETINVRESTCAQKGYAGDVYCNDCGLIVAIGGELDYAEHKYDSVITAPTPDAQGYTTHTCAVCGDSYVDSYTEYIDENAPQIIVVSKKCLAGKTVEVTVALKNNPGIASAKLTLDFDTTVLTLTKVTDAGNLGIQCHKPELTSPYTLAWMNDTATEDFTFNGTIVTLTFEIAEDAELGDYIIDLSYDYDNYDIWNVNVEKVKFAVVDGVISVIDTIIGDVNGDGAVNTLDRMELARHLANWEGYSAESIDMIAADVNNDGIVNTLDRMALARHLANWSGYETLPCEM